MKTIVPKRADELVPGDIIPEGFNNRPRRVVVMIEPPVPGEHALRILALTLGQSFAAPSAPDIAYPDETIPVERDTMALTPAQQHADELLAFVHDVEAATTGDRSRSARALLDKIDPPQPPTLDEALRMLDALTPALDGEHVTSAAHQLLDRARRTGLLP